MRNQGLPTFVLTSDLRGRTVLTSRRPAILWIRFDVVDCQRKIEPGPLLANRNTGTLGILTVIKSNLSRSHMHDVGVVGAPILVILLPPTGTINASTVLRTKSMQSAPEWIPKSTQSGLESMQRSTPCNLRCSRNSGSSTRPWLSRMLASTIWKDPKPNSGLTR